MDSCLGISTEGNLIKYAKISKNHDDFSIDAYGVKFSDNIEDAIEQIVEETESGNTPININLTDEMYNNFEVFAGLKKKDIEAVLASEFELLCDDKSWNFKALSSQFILSDSPMDKEKKVALYVSANKGEIAEKVEKLKNYKITHLIPVPIALYNLLDNVKENTAIINIEDKTTVTLIVNGQITHVDIIEIGMKQILDKINIRENSYARAYEACKNTTIYTMDVTDAQITGGEYLQDIMPILYEIITQVKAVLDKNLVTVQKIKLTGTATIINNLELYFQEYFPSSKCELLNPEKVLQNASNINVREYMEANSAIAIARQGLGFGIQDTNFKNSAVAGSVLEELKKLATSDVNFDSISTTFNRIIQSKKSNKKNKEDKKENSGKKIKLDTNFKGKLTKSEKIMVRIIVLGLSVLIIYTIVSIALTNMINDKMEATNLVINNTNNTIKEVESDTEKIKSKTQQYVNGITRLETLNSKIRSEYQYRKAIPNLLNRIMVAIPEQVQITAVENQSQNNVKISCQSSRYEELGYFGAVLKNQGILLDVQTSAGTRETNLVKIDIEGNLPWKKFY